MILKFKKQYLSAINDKNFIKIIESQLVIKVLNINLYLHSIKSIMHIIFRSILQLILFYMSDII